MKYMFILEERILHGFYKKVLYNMQSFWFGLDRNKLISDINKVIKEEKEKMLLAKRKKENR